MFVLRNKRNQKKERAREMRKIKLSVASKPSKRKEGPTETKTWTFSPLITKKNLLGQSLLISKNYNSIHKGLSTFFKMIKSHRKLANTSRISESNSGESETCEH